MLKHGNSDNEVAVDSKENVQGFNIPDELEEVKCLKIAYRENAQGNVRLFGIV